MTDNNENNNNENNNENINTNSNNENNNTRKFFKRMTKYQALAMLFYLLGIDKIFTNIGAVWKDYQVSHKIILNNHSGLVVYGLIFIAIGALIGTKKDN